MKRHQLKRLIYSADSGFSLLHIEIIKMTGDGWLLDGPVRRYSLAFWRLHLRGLGTKSLSSSLEFTIEWQLVPRGEGGVKLNRPLSLIRNFKKETSHFKYELEI